jgi:hypothetical protein
MNSNQLITKKLYMKNFMIFSLLFGLCILFSCTSIGSSTAVQTDLTATVLGAISGNPRNNLKVTLYDTEKDADDNTNGIATEYTNGNGSAVFYNVVIGRTYWVRAQALLSKSIRKTGSMKAGKNYFSMKIL